MAAGETVHGRLIERGHFNIGCNIFYQEPAHRVFQSYLLRSALRDIVKNYLQCLFKSYHSSGLQSMCKGTELVFSVQCSMFSV